MGVRRCGYQFENGNLELHDVARTCNEVDLLVPTLPVPQIHTNEHRQIRHNKVVMLIYPLITTIVDG
jgi:hypothetical protein